MTAKAAAANLVTIVAGDRPYRPVNAEVRAALEAGIKTVELSDVRGHRYIGCGLTCPGRIVIHGVPGNDLAMFMDGP
jgi:hypothetical protein